MVVVGFGWTGREAGRGGEERKEFLRMPSSDLAQLGNFESNKWIHVLFCKDTYLLDAWEHRHPGPWRSVKWVTL